ncbi:MAG: hypothetical protein H6658_02435 [Ardenticatenaceae bacterium]|nr:hypothetical protein [Ardenticatenaceae bacterium]
MSDEQAPDVKVIKEQERLKIDIPVEEEISKADVQDADVVTELKDLGRQFADTLRTAWNSQERQRIEAEIREGMKSFADEVDKVLTEVKESQAAARVREEAGQVASKVESSDVGRKARTGLAQGLQWLSEELGKLAGKFTPTETNNTDNTEA